MDQAQWSGSFHISPSASIYKWRPRLAALPQKTSQPLRNSSFSQIISVYCKNQSTQVRNWAGGHLTDVNSTTERKHWDICLQLRPPPPATSNLFEIQALIFGLSFKPLGPHFWEALKLALLNLKCNSSFFIMKNYRVNAQTLPIFRK